MCPRTLRKVLPYKLECDDEIPSPRSFDWFCMFVSCNDRVWYLEVVLIVFRPILGNLSISSSSTVRGLWWLNKKTINDLDNKIMVRNITALNPTWNIISQLHKCVVQWRKTGGEEVWYYWSQVSFLRLETGAGPGTLLTSRLELQSVCKSQTGQIIKNWWGPWRLWGVRCEVWGVRCEPSLEDCWTSLKAKYGDCIAD